MMFLSGQLSEYLHDHVTTSTNLYVEGKGFRLPQRLNKDNLEENMKYIEVQLNKYLHSHTVDAGFGEGEVALDPEVDLHQGDIPGTTEGMSPDKYFWVDGGNHTTEVSTTNPHTGANHIAITMNGNGFPLVAIADPQWTGINQPNTGLMSAGDEVQVSVWAVANAQLAGRTFVIEILFYANPGSGIVGFVDDTVGTMTTSYQKFTSAVVVAPINTNAFVAFVYPSGGGQSGDAWDLDTFSVNGRVADPNVLYTNPEGFRFPNDWKGDGAIAFNRKYLETQISKYLHSHEVNE
jgi:hypothetical protein